MDTNKFTLSNVVGVLSFIATVLTFGASFLDKFDPHYAVYALAAAAAISAFTGRITGTPGK